MKALAIPVVLAPAAAAAGREVILVLFVAVCGVLILTAAVLFAPREAPTRRACRLIATLRPRPRARDRGESTRYR